jgi:hypothetical protein
MPHPILYLWATGVALVAAVLGTFAIHHIFSRMHSRNDRISAVIGLAFGVALGLFALQLSVAWPPANALDRFVTIVLPAAFVVEIVAASGQVSFRAWQALLRLALIGNSGWILLFGSVYLRWDQNGGQNWQWIVLILVTAALLIIVWLLMTRLMDRARDGSIPISIAMTACFAGLLVMMAGYLKGGAAAFPLASALVGVAAASYRLQLVELTGTIFIGIVGLFGILFIGRFFGGLTNWTAVVVLLAPLSGWFCEIPILRQPDGWKRFMLRLIVVAIPLAIVFVCAWIEFKREMGPLL